MRACGEKKFMPLTQREIARYLGRSQSWVSKRVARELDPLPTSDLVAVQAWAARHGAPPAVAGDAPPQTSAADWPAGDTLDAADIRLKQAREAKLRAELESMTGALVPRTEVEERELLIASEFRRVAVDYPLRARSILERYIQDPDLIARVVSDLEPLAAEFLNRADARRILKGKTPDEMRAILHRHVETLICDLAGAGNPNA